MNQKMLKTTGLDERHNIVSNRLLHTHTHTQHGFKNPFPGTLLYWSLAFTFIVTTATYTNFSRGLCDRNDNS